MMQKGIIIIVIFLLSTFSFSMKKKRVCISLIKTYNVKHSEIKLVNKLLASKIMRYNLFTIADKRRYQRHIKILKMTENYRERDLSPRKKAIEMAIWLNARFLVWGKLIFHSKKYHLKIGIINTLTGKMFKSFSQIAKSPGDFSIIANHVSNSLYSHLRYSY